MSLKANAALLLALTSIPMLAPRVAAAPAAKEIGIWYDDTGDGAIKIEPCGEKLCGKLVWLKQPLNDKGQPLFDRHNSDESKRKRPICGLPIFGDLARQADGSWDSGWVYDPHEGKSYSFTFALAGADKLQVTGYLGMKLLGKTMVWTRAPTNLPSCAAQPATAQVTPPPTAKPAAPAATVPAASVPAAATAKAANSNPATPPAKLAAPAAKAASAATQPIAKAKSAPATKPASAASDTGEALPWTAKTTPEKGASQLGGPATNGR